MTDMQKTSKVLWSRWSAPFSVTILAFGLIAAGGCRVEKTEEGEMPDVDVEADAGKLPEYEVVKTEEGRMPDVDVEADAGKLPEYDVEGPDVDVGTKQTKVTVPKVKVVLEEEEVTVPYIDIDLPGEDDDVVRAERQLTVKLEVPNAGYDVEIQEIYVVGDELWVISTLEAGQGGVAGVTTVSDTVVVNAKDMEVRHYVIGEPVRVSSNRDYEFIPARSEIDRELSSAQVIYTS